MSRRVVLVGAGKVGQKEARVLRIHPDYELVCVCEPDERRRRSVAENTGTETYRSLEDALAAENRIDLVQIATPPATHHSLAMEALEAGTDVYLEKIMTLSTAEATDIVDAAAERGRSVYVRRNSLYTPAFRRLFTAIEDVGTVKRVSFFNAVSPYEQYSDAKAAWLRALPGGGISEHLPHALYVTRRLLGTEPTDIDVRYDGETLSAELYTDDAVGSITYVPPGQVAKTIVVVGTEGALLLNEDSRQLTWLRTASVDNPKMRIAIDNVSDITTSVSQAVSTGIGHLSKHVMTLFGSDRGRLERNTHYRQLSDIAGTPEHDISGEEGRKNVAVFESVWNRAGELD
jgi:predicted dehydrogenase